MMEVEPLSYIFGSFSRRKQSHQESKRSSKDSTTSCFGDSGNCAEETPIFQQDNCPLCSKPYIEPRVLKCLHTFCSSCLLELLDDQSAAEASDCFIICPTCDCKTDLPANYGISELPINYLLLHRMVLATLNAPSTKLLCDLCPNEVTAIARCSECALSICAECAESHRNSHKKHEILSLNEGRKRGITKVRKQIMCQTHPENELGTFCNTCSQMVCLECSHTVHKTHTFESPNKAVKLQTTNIRVAVNRTKSTAEKSLLATARLEVTAERIESHCDRIEKEIETFTDSYIKAVEEHRRCLFEQLARAREEKFRSVETHRTELQRRVKNAQDAIRFSSDILKEGSDIEILTFVQPILNRLESCYISDGPDLRISESLQFLPEEVAATEDNVETCCPLYGVITTQTISVKNCTLNLEGLENLRVGRRAEAILETKDSSDNALQRGGESVHAELVHRDGGITRSLPVSVEDKRDGTYRIFFLPDVAGKMQLNVSVKGETLKDCPYNILVRSLRAHRGTYHCCTFCSSGGNKDALCGCQGTMPGGYKGCGHGHYGHPGRRHWSCCGNVLEHSECIRTNSITHYQFTL